MQKKCFILESAHRMLIFLLKHPFFSLNLNRGRIVQLCLQTLEHILCFSKVVRVSSLTWSPGTEVVCWSPFFGGRVQSESHQLLGSSFFSLPSASVMHKTQQLKEPASQGSTYQFSVS